MAGTPAHAGCAGLNRPIQRVFYLNISCEPRALYKPDSIFEDSRSPAFTRHIFACSTEKKFT